MRRDGHVRPGCLWAHFPLCYAARMPTPLPMAQTATEDPRPNLLAFSPSQMAEWVQSNGWPRYRTQQILRWLYAKRARTIEDMTDLSRADRTVLGGRARIDRLACAVVRTADDGTKKFLFSLEDGLSVESVMIPDGRRLTLCISSQVGCTFDCTFCLTGTMGLQRNLKAYEIVDQVLSVQDRLPEHTRLTNLVFMGMGEPLANFDAVSDAVTILTDTEWGVGIAARRITLSTAGMASRLADVARLGVNVAVSLSATTEAQRAALMPVVSRRYPLAALMDACRAFPLKARSRLTFEYVLLGGCNDSPGDATRLVALLRGFRCKVNLIPFNEFPNNPFRRPSDAAILRFQAVLRKAGIDTFIRKSKGPDVLGACGQLGVQAQTPPADASRLDSIPARLLACEQTSSRTPA